MNDAQVWTVLGGMLALVASQTAMVLLVVRTSIDGLRGELDARFDRVDARFGEVNARFGEVNARFDTLDRDVQRIVEIVFRRQE